MKRFLAISLVLLISLSLLAGCTAKPPPLPPPQPEPEGEANAPLENQAYHSKEEVALYLHLYGHLPPNFITKSEAMALGWQSNKGNLWEVAPGKSIGGDKFGNREGLLPKAQGRQYYECDVDYQGGFRGSERLVYSGDGLIYYTEDHYDSFILLYGEEEK